MNKVKGLVSNLLLIVMVVVQVMGTSNVMTAHASTGMTQLDSVIVSGGSFNTGIYIDENYKVEMTFSLSTISQYKDIFYAAMGSSYAYRLRNESTNGFLAQYGWYKTKKAYQPQINQELVVIQDEVTTYVNGTQIQKASKVQDLTATGTLRFGDLVGSIKGFRVWNEADVLVANYVPVLDNSGNACMYDKVKGQLLYYSGTCKAGEKLAIEQAPEVSESVDNNTADSNTSSEVDSSTNITEENTTIETETTDNSSVLEDSSNSASDVNYVDSLTLTGGNFDTGVKINQNYSIEIIASVQTNNQYKNLYCAMVDSKNIVYRVRLDGAKGLYFKHGWYNEKVFVPVENEEFTLLQKKNVVYLNGTQIMKATLQTLESGYTLKFGDYSGTIKSFKLWNEAGDLIADYRPALNESGRACLYDTIAKDYIYYSGTCRAVVNETETEETTESSVTVETEIVESNGTIETEIVESNGTIETEVVESNGTIETESTEGTTKEDDRTVIKKNMLALLVSGDDTTSYDISKYGLTWKEVQDIYYEMISEGEGLIAHSSTVTMYYTTTKDSQGRALTFKLANIDDGYLARYKKVKAIVDETVAKTKEMSELEKVIYVHDYIVANTAYKLSGNVSYTAGGALGEGKAVCSGYSRAMMLLLECIGVESEYVSSDSMNHAWVRVKVNGNWYHVDPTWNDTRSAIKGQVSHKFLLCTDEEFLNGGSNKHYGWDGDIVSADKTFSNWKIHDIIGKLTYSNGEWYYLDSATSEKVEVEI